MIRLSGRDDPLLKAFTAPLPQNICRWETWARWRDVSPIDISLRLAAKAIPADDFDESILSEKHIFRKGRSLSAALLLKNQGERPVILNREDLADAKIFIIRADGKRIRFPARWVVQNPFEIPPREAEVWLEMIPETVADIPLSESREEFAFAEPGKYQAFVVAALGEGASSGRGGYPRDTPLQKQACHANLLSQPIEVEVLDDDAFAARVKALREPQKKD